MNDIEYWCSNDEHCPMNKIEYWCSNDEHWVSETRIPKFDYKLEPPICWECWQHQWDNMAECNRLWAVMQPIARVKTELHPSFSFWEE